MSKQKRPVEFAHFTPEESVTVRAIVKRAVELSAGSMSPLDVEMDLAAVHHHTPLDLGKLLAADTFNFSHDVGGIFRHIDRRTGKLRNHFLPRCARPQRETSGAQA